MEKTVTFGIQTSFLKNKKKILQNFYMKPYQLQAPQDIHQSHYISITGYSGEKLISIFFLPLFPTLRLMDNNTKIE